MKYRLPTLMLLSLLLTGCASDKSLYYWGDYQDNLYQTLKYPEANPSEQIIGLEKIISVAGSKDKQIPPGLYANLGLLYIQEGKLTQAKASFEKEQTLYPESTTYMTFLINNMEGKGNKHD